MINGCDHASVDRIIILNFRSYGFDLIGDPSRAKNLSRYNCEIGRWILIHLNGFEARVV